MRLIILFLILPATLLSQNPSDKITLLSKLFSSYQVSDYSFGEVFETKARGQFASVPINKCYYIKLSKDLAAMAFNIYLSPVKENYENAQYADVTTLGDIQDDTSLIFENTERFIQLVFYDLKNNKFIGVPPGFPIEGLKWLPEGMGDMTEIMEISEFKKLDGFDSLCRIKIDQCPECLGGISYFFSYKNNKLQASDRITGCTGKVKKVKNRITVEIIKNCYEVQYDNAEPEIITKDLFEYK